jgi:hypothetical protein
MKSLTRVILCAGGFGSLPKGALEKTATPCSRKTARWVSTVIGKPGRFAGTG